MDPALFSPSYLFRGEDGEEGEEGEVISTQQQTYEERNHVFPGGVELHIREFSFHQLNANFLWPGTFVFSEWLLQHQSCLRGQRILELGSGTGALAIFLRKSFGADITTSDIDDEEVEGNIAHNCRSNGLAVLPHIRHTWGDTFPTCAPGWELVIAGDILLYVKQYSNLIKTLCFLLKSYKHNDDKKEVHGDSSIKKTVTIAGKGVQWPVFLMSWRRRIGKDEEALFFRGCANAGLLVEHFGSRVYCISPVLGN